MTWDNASRLLDTAPEYDGDCPEKDLIMTQPDQVTMFDEVEMGRSNHKCHCSGSIVIDVIRICIS